MQCVSYSTCSIHKEENECVVERLLEKHGNEWKLYNSFPEWKTRGIVINAPETPTSAPEYDKDPIAKYCIRTYPEENKTNGFFVAIFVRINSKPAESTTNKGQQQQDKQQATAGSLSKAAQKKKKQKQQNKKRKQPIVRPPQDDEDMDSTRAKKQKQ